jgi:hypothetical protein
MWQNRHFVSVKITLVTSDFANKNKTKTKRMF